MLTSPQQYQISQRQSVLNEVFLSCFNSTNYLFREPKKERKTDGQDVCHGVVDPFIGTQPYVHLRTPRPSDLPRAVSKLTLDELLQEASGSSDEVSIDLVIIPQTYELIVQFIAPVNPHSPSRKPSSPLMINVQLTVLFEGEVAETDLGMIEGTKKNIKIKLDYKEQTLSNQFCFGKRARSSTEQEVDKEVVQDGEREEDRDIFEKVINRTRNVGVLIKTIIERLKRMDEVQEFRAKHDMDID